MSQAENGNFDYNKAVEEQSAKLIQKRGTDKPKELISKDVQYFDSTELPRILNQVRDVEEGDKVKPQPENK